MRLSDVLRRFFFRRFPPPMSSGGEDRFVDDLEREATELEQRLRRVRWQAQAAGIRGGERGRDGDR